jgi:hypothetical protein
MDRLKQRQEKNFIRDHSRREVDSGGKLHSNGETEKSIYAASTIYLHENVALYLAHFCQDFFGYVVCVCLFALDISFKNCILPDFLLL